MVSQIVANKSRSFTMSAGYASRLSDYPNKGKVGLPEFRETSRALKQKLDRLSTMVKRSRNLVILTGAGISTSAGIPDFRGPKGIWTIEKQQRRQNRKRKRERDTGDPSGGEAAAADSAGGGGGGGETSMDFSKARPTLTHRAITKLACAGKLKYCITQNVDGLVRL